MKLDTFKEEYDWFCTEATGAGMIVEHKRRPLIYSALQLADHVGFDFRTEILKVNVWIAANPERCPKKHWAKFWAGCFSRAKADGRETKGNFEAEMEKFK